MTCQFLLLPKQWHVSFMMSARVWVETPFPYLMTGPGAGAAVTAAGVFSNIMEARASKGWSDICWEVNPMFGPLIVGIWISRWWMVCAEPQLPIVEKMVLPLFLGGLRCGMALSMLSREWTLSHCIYFHDHERACRKRIAASLKRWIEKLSWKLFTKCNCAGVLSLKGKPFPNICEASWSFEVWC